MNAYLKIVVGIMTGFILSWWLYPLTHSNKVIPELAGITAGCMAVLGIFAWLGATSAMIMQLMAAFASVGLGVAMNRTRMAIRLENGKS